MRAPSSASIALACVGADLAEPGTALADDDGLLGRTLHVEIDPDIEERPVLGPALAGNNFIDHDGQGVRQFVPDAFEGGLADELGDHDGFRLVRQVPVRVQRRRRRHVADEHISEGVDLEAVRGGDRNDVLPAVLAEDFPAQGGDGKKLLGEGLPVHQVCLGHNRR